MAQSCESKMVHFSQWNGRVWPKSFSWLSRVAKWNEWISSAEVQLLAKFTRAGVRNDHVYNHNNQHVGRILWWTFDDILEAFEKNVKKKHNQFCQPSLLWAHMCKFELRLLPLFCSHIRLQFCFFDVAAGTVTSLVDNLKASKSWWPTTDKSANVNVIVSCFFVGRIHYNTSCLVSLTSVLQHCFRFTEFLMHTACSCHWNSLPEHLGWVLVE